MNKNIIIGLLLMFYGCGNAESDNTEDITSSENNEIIEENIGESEQDTTNHSDLNMAKPWQINDYSSYFLESPIASSSDEVKWEEGEMWYFETLDLANGFARVDGAIEGNYEFALWRMANGNDLIGKTWMACGPVCDYGFNFYEQEKGEGEEVTESVLPMKEISAHQEKLHQRINEKYTDIEYPQDSQLRFFLPQSGTSMMVNIVVGADEVEFPLLKLKWNKKQFLVDEYYDDINLK